MLGYQQLASYNGITMVKTRGGLGRMMSHDIAVDLGTANTLVSLAGHGIVINEPSVVATNRRTKKVIAIGAEAKKMVGRTPKSILAAKPLVDGVVSDFEVTEHMLKHFIETIHRTHKVLIRRPRMIVGLPAGVTEVEKRAVVEAARSAGARKIYLIEEPVAAAIGSGLDISDERGCMVVDIGGGTTEIAILASGGVVNSRSIRIAGDEMTEVIVQFLREEFNLQIGERTAEELKNTVGSVYAKPDMKVVPVRGRNLITGLPQEIELNSELLRVPLSKQARPIVEGVKTILEETPPELISDIMQRGIVLTGGGALIGGLDQLIRQESHIDVLVPDNALTTVVEGAAEVLAAPNKFREVLLESD